jgi:hypothetical protein
MTDDNRTNQPPPIKRISGTNASPGHGWARCRANAETRRQAELLARSRKWTDIRHVDGNLRLTVDAKAIAAEVRTLLEEKKLRGKDGPQVARAKLALPKVYPDGKPPTHTATGIPLTLRAITKRVNDELDEQGEESVSSDSVARALGRRR